MFFQSVVDSSDTDKVIAIIPAAPGWRVATLTQEGDKYRVGVRALERLGLTARALNSSGGGMLPFPGPPLVVPVDEAGAPLHSYSRVCSPSDTRSDEEVLASYIEHLKKEGVAK